MTVVGERSWAPGGEASAAGVIILRIWRLLGKALVAHVLFLSALLRRDGWHILINSRRRKTLRFQLPQPACTANWEP